MEIKGSIDLKTVIPHDELDALRKVNEICDERLYGQDLERWGNILSLIVNDYVFLGADRKESLKVLQRIFKK
jgi:hypothetical protein